MSIFDNCFIFFKLKIISWQADEESSLKKVLQKIQKNFPERPDRVFLGQ